MARVYTRPRATGKHIKYNQAEVDRWCDVLKLTPSSICKKADLSPDCISMAKHMGYHVESNYDAIMERFPQLSGRPCDIKAFSIEELQNELEMRQKLASYTDNLNVALDMAFGNSAELYELVARLKKSCELCIRAYMEGK